MNGVSRGRGLETKRKNTVALGQRSQVRQKFQRDPSRVKLCIWDQPPEVLPTKARQCISYLIVNPRYMLCRKGKTDEWLQEAACTVIASNKVL